MNIVDIEGIGPERAERLTAAGIVTTDDLLRQGGAPGGRKELASATGFTTSLILEWVNRADLLRISGVGSEYADLLEAAGVDSPIELAQRNPTNLAAKLREISDAQPDIVRRVPGESVVAEWITQAKTMQRMVWHGSEGPAAAAAPTMTPPATERPTTAAAPAMAPEPSMAAKSDMAAPAMSAPTMAPEPSMAAKSDMAAPAMSAPTMAAQAMAAESATAEAAMATASAEGAMRTSASSTGAAPAMAAKEAPAPVMTPRPATPSMPATPAPRPMTTMPPKTHERESLWFRIKRFLGMG